MRYDAELTKPTFSPLPMRYVQEYPAAWRSWGIWHKAPEIGLSVYRLDLLDGSFLRPAGMRATTSFRAAAWHGNVRINRPRFNLCDKGGKLKAGSKAESLLTDKLKELRKEMISGGNA